MIYKGILYTMNTIMLNHFDSEFKAPTNSEFNAHSNKEPNFFPSQSCFV